MPRPQNLIWVMPAEGAKLSDASVSERAGIAAIRSLVDSPHHVGTLGIGDDAAVLSLGGRCLACHDVLVESTHFRRDFADLDAIGFKAVAVNLSDIAAMGGVPRAVLVGLVLPPQGFSLDELTALYRGMRAAADPHGVTIVGGDTTVGSQLTIGITLIGELPHGHPVLTRVGAVLGDALCVTGPLGGAAAGLLLLDGTVDAHSIADADALIHAQMRPHARIDAGAIAASLGAHAGMDISDGLLLDASRLAHENQLAAVIDVDAVPLATGVADVARRAGRDPGVFAATGGEDYELLLAVAPADVTLLDAHISGGVTVVGRLSEGEGTHLERAGVPLEVAVAGWERP